MFIKSIGLVFLGPCFSSQRIGRELCTGIVKDANGHPIEGADIRIEAKNVADCYDG
jgi:hypothetical protein